MLRTARADPFQLAQTLDELRQVIESAVDGRNALYRVRLLIDSICNSEVQFAAMQRRANPGAGVLEKAAD
jgi:hypothetical protein